MYRIQFSIFIRILGRGTNYKDKVRFGLVIWGSAQNYEKHLVWYNNTTAKTHKILLSQFNVGWRAYGSGRDLC